MKKLFIFHYFMNVMFFCMKFIGDIFAYMQLIPKKVTKLKGKLLQYFKHLQAQMHWNGDVSHLLFSKLKQFFFFSKLKVEKMPLNTLVNCIMKSLFFIDTIFKIPKSFCFLILLEKSQKRLFACVIWQFQLWRQCRLKVMAKVY